MVLTQLIEEEWITGPIGRIESAGDDNETVERRRQGIGPVDKDDDDEGDRGWVLSILLRWSGIILLRRGR